MESAGAKRGARAAVLDLSAVEADAPRFAAAPGERVYAIGDVHGRADLFKALMAAIRDDNAGRPPAATRVVVLGDFIDRGPQSAEMTARLMRYRRASDRFVVLKGNHEQGMIDALGGDFTVLRSWLGFGGTESLESWGVPPDVLSSGSLPDILRAARQHVGPDVLHWLERLPHHHQSGDVLFVHAGIRPGVPLARQSPEDLLWIKEDFLISDAVHPFLVVHGHTIFEAGADMRFNRIGIDTGAYKTGRLTALGLEGAERWVVST